MKKSFPIYPFLIFLMLLLPGAVLAAITLQVPIGETERVEDLGDYIRTFYTFFVTSAGVLAAVMIVLGGYRWVVASGNAQKISEAKETIVSAVLGLVLALCSYVILNTINPNITSLKPLVIPIVQPLKESARLEYYNQIPHLKFTGTDSSAQCVPECVNGLKTAAEIYYAATAGEEEENRKLIIISGYRSIEAQRKLYAQNCPSGPESCNPPTCNPNTSTGCPHTSGQAIDIWRSGETIKPNMVNAMKQAGFCQLKSPNEPWHFEKPKRSSGCY